MFLLPILLTLSPFIEQKNELATLHEKLSMAPQDAHVHYRLALAYFRDQEVDKAFFHFLKSLDCKEKEPTDTKESPLYLEALQLYLDQCAIDPISCAEQLIEKYEKLSAATPQDLQLTLLLATAYANTGKFDLFFEHFFRIYPFLNDHYLVYKARGIILSRLIKHGVDQEAKKKDQRQMVQELEHALQKEPRDASLYKILILCADEEDNGAQMIAYLKNLLLHRVKFPRSDICFYVYAAANRGELELAKKILDLAKEYYPYSKNIIASLDYLNRIEKVDHARPNTR